MHIYLYNCQLDLSNFQAMVQIHLLNNDNFSNFQTMFQIHLLSNDKNRNLVFLITKKSYHDRQKNWVPDICNIWYPNQKGGKLMYRGEKCQIFDMSTQWMWPRLQTTWLQLYFSNLFFVSLTNNKILLNIIQCPQYPHQLPEFETILWPNISQVQMCRN